MITLTPLSSSAASSSSSEPLCYLLELDEARIMLDMGQRDYQASTEQETWRYEEKLQELAPKVDLVLLSHSPTAYLSLYPFARARWGLRCPVYATQPTVEMGRVVCLAEAESWRAEHLVDEEDRMEGEMDGESSRGKGKKPLKGPFVPTVEEIHEAFDWIKPIRYNQPLHLGGDLSHLLLTPFPSGHTLGGTLFKLRSPTSGTVLYAVGINHTGERHLDGMVAGKGGSSGYEEGVLRPDLLIVEGGRSLVTNPKRRDREAALLDLVTGTLESDRSLLLPCDPSPRLLELLVLLDQHWSFKLTPTRQTNRPPEETWPYPLCVVSRTAQDMLAFARSLIEWMGGVIRDSGGRDAVEEMDTQKKRRKGRKGRPTGGALGSNYGALDFRHVRFFASPTDLLQAFPMMRPKLVLATPPTLSHGPSRWLFTAMAAVDGNVILLTSQGEDGTLARDLYGRWERDQDETATWGKGRTGNLAHLGGQLQIDMHSKVPLAGVELEEHLDAERLQKEREAAHQAALDRSRRMLEADDLDSESDVSDEVDDIIAPRAEGANAYAGDGEDNRLQMSFDIFVKGQQMRIGRGAPGEMARFRMFPFVERRGRKVDDYGEGLDIGQWVRKGREIEEEGETEEVREAKKRKVEDEERQLVPPEPPFKYITEHSTFDLKASMFSVDMDGLHDGQAIKTIISDLQPRKLILVRSSDEATQSLVNFFAATIVTNDIFTPKLGEDVRIGEHVASYSIMLGDSISAGLGAKWAKFEGYEVAMIDGKIAFSAGSTVPTLEESSVIIPPAQKEVKAEDEADGDTDMAVVKTEPGVSPSSPPQQITKPVRTKPKPTPLPGSLFVGDLRLARLKARLASLSIPAEFAGEGVLICGHGIHQGGDAKGGSIVAVRKLEEGRIVLEGGVGKVYFDVRRELYGGFAQVAAA